MEDSQLIHSFPNFMISGVQYSNSDTTHTKILGRQKEESEVQFYFMFVLCQATESKVIVMRRKKPHLE